MNYWKRLFASSCALMTIELGVFLLQLRMGKDVINTAANTLVKACRGTEARDGTLEFAAVKDDSRSLVA